VGLGASTGSGAGACHRKSTKNKLFPDLKNYSLSIFFFPAALKIDSSAFFGPFNSKECIFPRN